MLVNGRWVENWQPVQAKDEKGGFVRQVSGFRSYVTPDGAAGPTGQAGFVAEAGRYHLYVALICPWASRTLMARAIKGLERVVSVSVVEPELSDQGWRFSAGADAVNGAEYMHQIYVKADPTYSGRATVPVLWDKVTQTIVSNESADILRMFNTGFGALASGPDLYPAELQPQIEALNARIYPRLNNGVYRAGFATTQIAYDEAVADVFAELTQLESELADGRSYLTGETFTEADIRLFVTLIRFEAAYYSLFKTNLRPLSDFAKVYDYMQRVYALPGIAGTVNLDHVKRGYYSIKALNPNGIVPQGPHLSWYQGDADVAALTAA